METKQILCFGDSNTWGFCPQSTSVACCRYPFSQRWTGVLQGMLGDGYRIAEEGLNGRTTVFEDPLFPDRRGVDAIDMLVRTHSPLDLVLIMLGTNDMKDHLGTTNHAVARGVRALCEHALSVGAESGKKPRVLAVSPIAIGENVEGVKRECGRKPHRMNGAERRGKSFRIVPDQECNNRSGNQQLEQRRRYFFQQVHLLCRFILCSFTVQMENIPLPGGIAIPENDKKYCAESI